MKRQTILLVLFVVVAVLGLGWLSWWMGWITMPKKSTPVSVGTPASTAPAELPSAISYQGQDGKSVLELLKVDHQVIEGGGLILAIDDRVSTDNAGWKFTVNGQSVDQGANEYLTSSTETVSWTFARNE